MYIPYLVGKYTYWYIKVYRWVIEKVLLGKEEDQTAIIKALILIIYRYRNNLFHGEKEIASLPNQQENFDYANNFLMTCLEENPSIL